MDVHNLFILIFIQIVLVIGQKNGDAGKDVKTMTEKACKFIFVIQNHHVSDKQIYFVYSFYFNFMIQMQNSLKSEDKRVKNYYALFEMKLFMSESIDCWRVHMINC